MNVILIGVEGGYQLKLDPIFFVPNLELGVSIVNLTNSAAAAAARDESTERFYLSPGISAFYPIDMFFVGLDLNVMVIIADPVIPGLSIFATGGVRF